MGILYALYCVVRTPTIHAIGCADVNTAVHSQPDVSVVAAALLHIIVLLILKVCVIHMT